VTLATFNYTNNTLSFIIRLPRYSTIYKHKIDEKEKCLEETDEEREEQIKSQKTK